MFKCLKNNRGVALLTVMVIMTAVVTIGSVMLYMSSSESRMVYEYGNNSRAFYAAEAGADLLIREWKSYINTLPKKKDSYGNTLNELTDDAVANTKTFLEQPVLQDQTTKLINAFQDAYGNGHTVNILYAKEAPESDSLPRTESSSDPHFLIVNITGTYDHTEYDYRVQLWYYWDASIGSYKGFGTAKAQPPVRQNFLYVVDTVPANGDTNVTREGTIMVTFNEAIFSGDHYGSIRLVDDKNKSETVTKRIEDDTLLLDYTGLKKKTTYTVIIPVGSVKDSRGNSLTNEYSFSFTTQDESGGGGGGNPPKVDPKLNWNKWSAPWPFGKWHLWEFSKKQKLAWHRFDLVPYIYYPSQVYQEFTTEVKISVEGDWFFEPQGVVGLLFYYDPKKDDGHFFGLQLKSDKIVTGTLKNKNYISVPGKNFSGRVYTLKIESVGGTVTLFVDGEKVHSYKVDENSKGNIGLYETVPWPYTVIFQFL